ncbi:hypothetical protein BJ742DRAFT_317999 [Cladochytrium replicatum]|nr:hypothetical protein BJ742DRAFT_317999 [Cladochytrium replicatum]
MEFSQLDSLDGGNSLHGIHFLTKEKRDHLKTHGYVVIENVIPKSLCESTVAEMRDYIAPWPDTAQLPFLRSGVNFSVQLQSQMDIRQHPNLHRTFSELWGTPQLRSSFDRWCYQWVSRGSWRDAERSDADRMHDRIDTPDSLLEKSNRGGRDGLRWHTDADPGESDGSFPGFVQGIVNLIDCTLSCDGGFRAIDGGHRAHKKFFELSASSAPADKGIHMFPDPFIREIVKDGTPYLEDGDVPPTSPFPMPPRHIKCRAGDLILFYSTTPHGNVLPITSDPRANDRACVYVTMAPVEFETHADRSNRIAAFKKQAATSHRAVRGVELFEKYQPYGVEEKTLWAKTHDQFVRKRGECQVSELGMKLLGLDEWDDYLFP